MKLASLINPEVLAWLQQAVLTGHRLAIISPHPVKSKFLTEPEFLYNHAIQWVGSKSKNSAAIEFHLATLIIYVEPTPHHERRRLLKAGELPIRHLTTSSEEVHQAGFAFHIVRPTVEESSLYLVQQQLLKAVTPTVPDLGVNAVSVLDGQKVSRG